jgi:hypothetical protein
LAVKVVVGFGADTFITRSTFSVSVILEIVGSLGGIFSGGKFFVFFFLHLLFFGVISFFVFFEFISSFLGIFTGRTISGVLVDLFFENFIFLFLIFFGVGFFLSFTGGDVFS